MVKRNGVADAAAIEYCRESNLFLKVEHSKIVEAVERQVGG
jgi:hypothetical protein